MPIHIDEVFDAIVFDPSGAQSNLNTDSDSEAANIQ